LQQLNSDPMTDTIHYFSGHPTEYKLAAYHSLIYSMKAYERTRTKTME